MKANTQPFESRVKPLAADSVTLVSGLPRSGTSMMMRMLAAGGMPVTTDNIRKPNEDNPHGYFELERIKQLEKDNAWLKEEKGRAIKAISALLPLLPDDLFYYVIFMERRMTEILASQKKMLLRRGTEESDAIPDELMASKYRTYLEATYQWLERQPHFHVLYIHYSDIIKDPGGGAGDVNAFLPHPLDEAKMAAAVDPNLYRQRQ